MQTGAVDGVHTREITGQMLLSRQRGSVAQASHAAHTTRRGRHRRPPRRACAAISPAAAPPCSHFQRLSGATSRTTLPRTWPVSSISCAAGASASGNTLAMVGFSFLALMRSYTCACAPSHAAGSAGACQHSACCAPLPPRPTKQSSMNAGTHRTCCRPSLASCLTAVTA